MSGALHETAVAGEGKPLVGNGRLPDDYANATPTYLKLDKCNPDSSWYSDSLLNASLSVTNPRISCQMWLIPNLNYRILFSYVRLKSERIPVVVYFPLVRSSSRKLVVQVVGGPGGDIAPGINDALPDALAKHGIPVVKLGYRGTRQSTNYPNADFATAVSQIHEYLSLIIADDDSTNLIVLGESLGAHIVASAVDSSLKKRIQGIVLVHPLMYTPKQAIRNFKDIIEVNGAGDANIPANIASDAPELEPLRRNGIPSLLFFEAFFEKNYLEHSLFSYLKDTGPTKIDIFYSLTDSRTGASTWAEQLSRVPNIQMHNLGNTGHEVSAESADVIAHSILP